MMKIIIGLVFTIHIKSKENLLKNLCGNCLEQVEFEREKKLYQNKGHKILQIIK